MNSNISLEEAIREYKQLYKLIENEHPKLSRQCKTIYGWLEELERNRARIKTQNRQIYKLRRQLKELESQNNEGEN